MTPEFAQRVVGTLKGKIMKLPKPIQLADFTNTPRGVVTDYIRASMTIDNRSFNCQKFLIMRSNHDVFIGQDFWVQHRVGLFPANKSFIWPDDIPPLGYCSRPIMVSDSPPRRISLKHQADVIRRDRLIEKEDKEIKRRAILRRNWREPLNVHAIGQTTQGLPSSEMVPEGPISDDTSISSLAAEVAADPRQTRWASVPMPSSPVPLIELPEGIVTIAEVSTAPAATPKREQDWVKTFDGKHIPFPEGENPEHIELVRKALPRQLQHLEGFFSKKASTRLPPSRPGFDVVLELDRPITGQPARYNTPYAYMQLEKDTVEELARIGFIERCPDMPPHAAPTLFVPKKDTLEKRFCCDFRFINGFVKKRLTMAPDVPGTIARVGRAKRLSKVDIIRAFNRMLVALESRYLTAFKTRFGTYQWRVLPFGLSVGPAWFQALINAQLNELLDSIASAYADDVLIFTEEDDDDAHFKAVEEVIYRLHKADLQGDIKKSSFNVTETGYLGMQLDVGKGVSIDPEKIRAITDWSWDDINSKQAVRSFLGLCNYVRVFCHHASEAAEPLNRLLKKDAPFVKGPEQLEAFEKMKQLATEAPVLAFFKPGRPIKVECDASAKATGGVIWQEQDDKTWKPIGFSSKSMTPTEQSYPIQDQELLAVIHALKDNEQALWGTDFVVLTDHQALIYFSSKRILSTRQIRWSQYLANFDITWRYRPGKENVAADALSRKTIDNPTVKERERLERDLVMIPKDRIEAPVAALEGVDALVIPQGADLVDLIIKENQDRQLGSHEGKLIVPETTADGQIFLRTALIRGAHEPAIFAHGGLNKTKAELIKNYWWDGLGRDVRRYVANCRECQRNKTRRDKTPGMLHPIPVPSSVWNTVIVDGKTMPLDVHGYDYIWAFICKFSRLMVTLPGKKNDDAETLAKRYYRRVYWLLGMPQAWISDNAGPFISEFLETINKLTGTKHRHGSSRHPQTQGGVEITNANLDQRLRFYIDKYQTRWSEYLPSLDFAHNSSHHASLGMSPIMVVTGCEPRNPLSLPLPDVDLDSERKQAAAKMVKQIKDVQVTAHKNAVQAQKLQEAQANKKRRPVNWSVGDSVYVHKKGFTTEAPTTRLDSQWAGPWRIKEERGFSYVLETPDWYKGSPLFHADRLRKAADDPLPQQHTEPEPPDEIDGEPEWEVERILASRIVGRGNNQRLQYQVTWTGLEPDETFYNADGFKNAATKLESFHREYPDAAGPPVRLQTWIREAAEDLLHASHPDDNRAEHGAKGSLAPKRHKTRHK
ncbi:uncharacterized protein CPUR_08773 [Claviceps purpurea 20.1]|uniref:Reverse transcriptase n=1 Tax=Claviceps purpurea (strain 20.1) TaxID=1111077 RepID=M1WIP4_CLAP2|nr:uncharacterized protein CPUR_08773 [Claviceps purpurea 20.1]